MENRSFATALVPMLLFVLAFTVDSIAQVQTPEWGEEAGTTLDRVSFHGYGEIHFNDPETGTGVPDSGPARMDFHRMVIGLSYSFSERIVLQTEVDFEHAASELELELAYLDFRIKPEINIRAGSVLMPVGPLNEFHEPPLFYSVERPYVQTYIIPTTWTEGGVGVFGSLWNGTRYSFYIVSGLDAGGFSAAKGIRGGRGKVAREPSEDLAVVGRIQVIRVPGVDTGFSFYWGRAGQGTRELGDASVGVLEGDVRVRSHGVDLRAVVVRIGVGGADRISGFNGETIGEVMLGWYAEAAYNLFQTGRFLMDQALVAFLRFEAFDTQHDSPVGFVSDPGNDREVLDGGLAYYPHPDIALKADWERWTDGLGRTGERINLAMAFQY